MSDLKKAIRKEILIKRKHFDLDEFHTENDLIIKNVQTLLSALYKDLTPKRELGLYLPLKGEPDLTKIMLNSKWAVSLPKIEDNKIKFVYYKIGDKLKKCEKGTMQPVSDSASIPNVIFAPGLSYSTKGHRLGFGGGYYDKYFSERKSITTTAPIKIGVCFDEFLIEYLPSEKHDIKFDYIITNKTILKL